MNASMDHVTLVAPAVYDLAGSRLDREALPDSANLRLEERVPSAVTDMETLRAAGVAWSRVLHFLPWKEMSVADYVQGSERLGKSLERSPEQILSREFTGRVLVAEAKYNNAGNLICPEIALFSSAEDWRELIINSAAGAHIESPGLADAESHLALIDASVSHRKGLAELYETILEEVLHARYKLGEFGAKHAVAAVKDPEQSPSRTLREVAIGFPSAVVKEAIAEIQALGANVNLQAVIESFNGASISLQSGVYNALRRAAGIFRSPQT